MAVDADWKIAAHADTATAAIDLCRIHWPTPFELTLCEAAPTISLNLAPPHGHKEGRYAAPRADFLPMGDILFHPAGTRLETRGLGGDQSFLRVMFRDRAPGGGEGPDLDIDPADPHVQRALLDVRQPEVAGAMRRIADELARPGMASAFLLDGLTTLLAVDLARGLGRLSEEDEPARGGLAGWQLNRVRERIAEADIQPPTVSELATLVRLSPRHLSRAWRASTGTTLSDAVEDARQARAEAMIRAGDRQLKEIAYLLGFSSPSSFSTAFRRRTGMSPQEFARR
ncbi:helix-turn-helix domain-containing protein [Edaphosphingomonas haloaromaticamans]|uniref:HTH-type transcriptional activator RhaR n=1 Tax=Edaphosphingomonas haloaromaticamans TaxID=653954 RepID=A0A1S1HFZ3_9SPHN|nr:AraC family transcriptional regulator [Sphingomonas haloaromaticamans]OHT21154.1 HTH-type transcriptional activator RhaR [Sphingomonas haloaromaticamans]